MRLSSVDFLGCGFPEEYIFIVTVILSAIIMISFVLLHFLVDEEYFNKRTWLPIIFYFFNQEAFTKSGNIVRLVAIISILLLLLILCIAYYLYKYEILSCGQIR